MCHIIDNTVKSPVNNYHHMLLDCTLAGQFSAYNSSFKQVNIYNCCNLFISTRKYHQTSTVVIRPIHSLITYWKFSFLNSSSTFKFLVCEDLLSTTKNQNLDDSTHINKPARQQSRVCFVAA